MRAVLRTGDPIRFALSSNKLSKRINFLKLLLANTNTLLYTTSLRSRWVWPSWLRRQIVALEIVGSSPIIHPSARLKK